MKYRLRIYNFSLYIQALFSVIRFGKRKEIEQHPKKVLVIQLAKLGDMVCFTPVLRALKEHRPETKVYLLGDALNKAVMDGNRDIDEYVVFQKQKIREIIRFLRQEKIDVACVRGTPFIGLVIALLSGIPGIIATRVVAGRGFETRTYKWLLRFVRTVDFSFGTYMPREFLRLLEPMGIFATDTQKHLSFSEHGKATVTQFFLSTGIDKKKDFVVGVAPSAGSKIKEWPEERFSEVINHLLSRHNAWVLVIGGPSDKDIVSRVIARSDHSSRVLNTQGIFNMDETKALISKLNLFVSVDTGPVYIAEAFKVPTIDIVGPVDEREQPPQGPFNRNIVPIGRVKPEISILNARMYNREEAIRQIRSITVTQVTEEIDRLVSDMGVPEVL